MRPSLVDAKISTTARIVATHAETNREVEEEKGQKSVSETTNRGERKITKKLRCESGEEERIQQIRIRTQLVTHSPIVLCGLATSPNDLA